MPTPPIFVLVLLAIPAALMLYAIGRFLLGTVSIGDSWNYFVFPGGAAATVIIASWGFYRTFWLEASNTLPISLTAIGLAFLLFAANAVISTLPWRIRCRRAPWADR